MPDFSLYELLSEFKESIVTAFFRRLTPCHHLAQLAVFQIEQQQLLPQDIVKSMGYSPKHTLQACDRLRHVLNSPVLGLDNSYLDSQFGSTAFLTALFAVLKISPNQYQAELEKLSVSIAP